MTHPQGVDSFLAAKTSPMLEQKPGIDADWEVPQYRTEEFFERRSRYCVIIPVMNEGKRITKQLERMRDILGEYDTIIADFGSSDGSTRPEVVQPTGVRAVLTKEGPGFLSAQQRMGLSFALSEGYEGMILIDGNNKDNPSAIPEFARMLATGWDHVQGSRFIKGGKHHNTPLSRLLGIRLLHAPLISLAAGVRYTDSTNGFRAYSSKLLLHPKVKPFRNCFFRYELHYYLAIRAGQLGMKVQEIPVERVYPPGKPPTKITKFRGNLIVLKTLFDACLGRFNPA